MSQGSPALGPTSDDKNVSFNNTFAIYFTSKVGLFGKSQRDCSFGNASYGEPWANLENEEGELTFIRKKGKLGGTLNQRVHWQKLGIQGTVDSHWWASIV